MITFSVRVMYGVDVFTLVPPMHLYYADPFVLIAEGGVVEALVECYSRFRRKADIRLLRVDFRQRTYTLTRLIDEAYHLSYPFIVRHGGAVYVLPESCSAGVQKIYQLSRCQGELRAHVIHSVEASYVDPTVCGLSLQGEGALRYYTGVSNHDGALLEDRIRFTPGAIEVFKVGKKVGRHRPGGWWSDSILPVQQIGQRYGFGLSFTDPTDQTLPSPPDLPAIVVRDQARVHHLSRHDDALAWDVCSDLSWRDIATRGSSFEVVQS